MATCGPRRDTLHSAGLRREGGGREFRRWCAAGPKAGASGSGWACWSPGGPAAEAGERGAHQKAAVSGAVAAADRAVPASARGRGPTRGPRSGLEGAGRRRRRLRHDRRRHQHPHQLARRHLLQPALEPGAHAVRLPAGAGVVGLLLVGSARRQPPPGAQCPRRGPGLRPDALAGPDHRRDRPDAAGSALVLPVRPVLGLPADAGAQFVHHATQRVEGSAGLAARSGHPHDAAPPGSGLPAAPPADLARPPWVVPALVQRGAGLGRAHGIAQLRDVRRAGTGALPGLCRTLSRWCRLDRLCDPAGGLVGEHPHGLAGALRLRGAGLPDRAPPVPQHPPHPAAAGGAPGPRLLRGRGAAPPRAELAARPVGELVDPTPPRDGPPAWPGRGPATGRCAPRHRRGRYG